MVMAMFIPFAFQFPSNGKVYSKEVNLEGNTGLSGFNSLQTGKCIASRASETSSFTITIFRFNSLQTGKCIARTLAALTAIFALSFNSLQTGKCIARIQNLDFEVNLDLLFQFPSNGKVYSKNAFAATLLRASNQCFNSLQTGKCIASYLETTAHITN